MQIKIKDYEELNKQLRNRGEKKHFENESHKKKKAPLKAERTREKISHL